MKYVGVDLHKQDYQPVRRGAKGRSQRVVVQRQRLALRRAAAAIASPGSAAWATFQVVVEATASYEWFVQLVEPLADACVLAHPGSCG